MLRVTLYIPQSRLTASQTIETELRNLTWVAGGMTAYPASGEWVAPNGESIVGEPVEVREYIVKTSALASFEAGLQRTIRELKWLGERSVLTTIEEIEVKFENA